MTRDDARTEALWEAFEYSNLGWTVRKSVNSLWQTLSVRDEATAHIYADALNKADADRRAK